MIPFYRSNLTKLKQVYYKMLIGLRKIDITFNRIKIEEYTKYRATLPDSIINQNYYIFSQPRSGSNWLAEILAHISDKNLIDEPLDLGLDYTEGRLPKFQNYSCEELSKLSFYFDQPIPLEANWEDAREFFRRLFKLEIASVKLFERANFRSLDAKSSFIIKFCHGNLLLPWLVKNFSIRPILLIRHPCAVISSLLKFRNVQKALKGKQYMVPVFKYNKIYTDHAKILNGLKTPEEILCGLWCLGIKNTIYSDLNNKSWLTISYESLYKNYDSEVRRILVWHDLDIDFNKIPNRNTPSMTTLPSSLADIKMNVQLASWKRRLSAEQISRILRVVELFDIDCYNYELEPDYERVYNLK